MKFRYLFLIFLVAMQLSFANNLSAEFEKKFQQAKKTYENQEYKKAYELFSKLFRQDLTHANVNYYLAKSAIKLEKYGMASAALERILIYNPHNNAIKVEKAKLQHLMGDTKGAIYALKQLFNEVNDDSLKKHIRLYLEKLESSRQRFRLTALVGASFAYSDNIKNAPNSKYTLPNFEYLGTQGEEKESDYYHAEFLNLDLAYEPKSVPNVLVKNNVLYLKKTLLENKSENHERFTYKPSVYFLQGKHLFTMGLSFERYLLGHNTSQDDFDSVGFNTRYYYQGYALEANAMRYFYDQMDKADKNYTNYTLSFKALNKKQFFYTSTFQKSLRFHSSRTDINKLSWMNRLSYRHFLPYGLSLEPSLKYKMTNYEHNSIAFNSRRKDRLFEYGVQLSKPLSHDWVATLYASHANNDSNHAEYDYKNNTLGLTIMKKIQWKF